MVNFLTNIQNDLEAHIYELYDFSFYIQCKSTSFIFYSWYHRRELTLFGGIKFQGFLFSCYLSLINKYCRKCILIYSYDKINVAIKEDLENKYLLIRKYFQTYMK